MKRVILATNNRDLAERSLKRRGFDSGHPALNWVESDADATKLIALKWKAKETKFCTLWYEGRGLVGPSDDTLADLTAKFGFGGVTDHMHWLSQ